MTFNFRRVATKIKRKIRKAVLQGNTIETKSELINWLGKQYSYVSYLEISTYTTGNFFNDISSKIFKIKECLNYYPLAQNLLPFKGNTINKDHRFTLMNYQESLQAIKQRHTCFDVILVDPFHTFEQSFTDIITALNLVSPTGLIVVHDCNPLTKELTGNTWKEKDWTGQTYESFIHFRRSYASLATCVVDIDYGCGIIRPNYPCFNPITIPPDRRLSELANWDYFTEHRRELLNLISIDQFKQYCQQQLK